MGTQYATSNYYRHERDTYREAYDLYLSNEEVPLIVKKICRHYKAGVPKIRFHGNRDSGSMGWGKMRLSNNPSLGLIIHELGHALKSCPEMQKILRKVSHKGTSHHGLRFQTCIWNIHNWAKSVGYWQDQLQKRRNKQADKVVAIIQEEKALEKPENAVQKKIDDTLKKIQKYEDAKVRYEKKLKRLEKLYATKSKKANRSIGALKRALVGYENKLKESA
jgi:hypothetical protein